MGYSVVEGPLDTARRVDRQAGVVNEFLAESDELDSYQLKDLVQVIHELDYQHPLVGTEVIIYGRHLTVSVGQDGDSLPFVLASEEERSPDYGNRGFYLGLVLRRVYVPETDSFFNMMVHRVETGSDRYYDDYLNLITRTTFAYTCAGDSVIVPIVPLNAHSLVDLENDDFLTEVDKVADNKLLNPVTRLRHITSLTNQMLVRTEDYGDRTFQRISYINSLGLLDNLVMRVKDFAIINTKTAPPVISNPSEVTRLINGEAEMSPAFLYHSPSYYYASTGKVEANLPQEVFAAYWFDEANIVLTSINRATNIRTLANS